MKYKKVVVSILILLLALPLTVYANNEQELDLSISEEMAKKICASFLDRSPLNWIGARVTFVDEFYDLNDEVLGYYYNVLNDKEVVGYVLVSSTKDLPPILQFGEQSLSYEVNEKIKNNKMYYLGAFKYEFGKNA